VAIVSDSASEPELVHELARALREAAREVAADGQPQVGAAYLREALLLLPEEARREALVDLAGLESLYDMRSAVEHWSELLKGVGSSEILAEAASALLALNPSARDGRAWTVARDAISDCSDPELRLRLLARIGVSAVLALDAGELRDQVVEQLRGPETATPGQKAALGVTAFADLWRGCPLAGVRRNTEALFRDDWVASLRQNDASYGLGMTALVICDSPLASQAIDEALHSARLQSASGFQGGILALRARARLRAGDLTGAAADAHAAFETYADYGGGPVPLAHALAALVEAESERGRFRAASQAVVRAPSDAEAGTLGLAGIRLARARLRAAAGAPEVAFDELMRIGADYESLGGGSPALLPWRSEAALAAKRIGRDAEALELADEEVAASIDSGSRAIGRALAARALVGPPGEASATASEAVRQLESVDAPLELTRALLAQAQASAAQNSQEAARKTFVRALALAERVEARPLARAAREGLVAVGGRPRRGSVVGVDGLTSAERRVAQAAARGLSNREIAADLHIAPGTVKNELAAVYRKLSVNSRSQLYEAFGSDSPAPSGTGSRPEPGPIGRE
jgi:DNA-binding NarL/FixJ family response regulator